MWCGLCCSDGDEKLKINVSGCGTSNKVSISRELRIHNDHSQFMYSQLYPGLTLLTACFGSM